MITILRRKTVDIPKRPGSATTTFTYTVEFDEKAWFKKYRVRVYYLEYTNLFEMSNGEEGIIGEFSEVMGKYKTPEEAIKHYDAVTDRQDIFKELREQYNGKT